MYFLIVPKPKIRQKSTETLSHFRDRLHAALKDAEPVSYTHLDVYKRQDYPKAGCHRWPVHPREQNHPVHRRPVSKFHQDHHKPPLPHLQPDHSYQPGAGPHTAINRNSSNASLR